MLSREAAEQLAREWVEVWNSHDLDAIMSHYAEDVQFWSPMIARVLGSETGTISGKAQLRHYFEQGLAKSPSLHFTLESLLVGVDSLVIVFSRHDGNVTAELMVLNDDLEVTMGRAHYLRAPG